MPLATIPAAWLVAYLPHSISLTVKLARKGIHYNNDTPRLDVDKHPRTVARATGAHHNALEMFPLFAVGVLLARVQKVKPSRLTSHCLRYLKLRVIYTLLYVFGFNRLLNVGRTVSWFLMAQTVFDIYGLAL